MVKNIRRKGYTPRNPRSDSSYMSSSYSETTYDESDDNSSPDSVSEHSYNYSIDEPVHESKSSKKFRCWLRKPVPAAIVMWAFRKLPSSNGLSSRRIITFLKKHYRVVDNPQQTGKTLGDLLRCAVEFGLLEKRGNKYFLAKKAGRAK